MAVADEHEVARVSLWIAHRAGNASRKVGNVSGLDLHPFAAQMHLALTLETEHRLVGHVVLVERTFLARRERQHVNALGLKTIPRPRNQPRMHTLRSNFNSVIQVTDRAARTNFVVGAKTRAPFFINHKILRAHRYYSARHLIDNSIRLAHSGTMPRRTSFRIAKVRGGDCQRRVR